jgi:hypothetical protein
MKQLPSLMVLALVLAGCATKAPDVTTQVNQFTNERTDAMEDVLLKGPGNPPREIIWLNATRYAKDFSHAPIFIGVKYMARTETGALDIDPGPSLTIVADSTSFKLTGSGSLNGRTTFKQDGQEFVQESALYEISRSQLLALSRAKKVQIFVKGQHGLVERELDKDALERLQRYVNHLAL